MHTVHRSSSRSGVRLSSMLRDLARHAKSNDDDSVSWAALVEVVWIGKTEQWQSVRGVWGESQLLQELLSLFEGCLNLGISKCRASKGFDLTGSSQATNRVGQRLPGCRFSGLHLQVKGRSAFLGFGNWSCHDLQPGTTAFSTLDSRYDSCRSCACHST